MKEQMNEQTVASEHWQPSANFPMEDVQYGVLVSAGQIPTETMLCCHREKQGPLSCQSHSHPPGSFSD